MTEVDNLIAKYIGIVDRLIAVIPYKRVWVWKEFFFNPSATVMKDNVGVVERLKDLYIANAVELLINLVALIPMLALFALFTLGVGLIWIGVIAAIILVSYLLGPIFAFIYSLIEYVVARALGGTGDIRANFNASALPGLAVFIITIPILILQIPFTWLSIVPIISLCASIVALPLSIALMIAGLYAFYLKYLAMKKVHGLSSMRAAGVVIIPIIAVIVLAIAAIILLYVLLAAVMFGTIGAGLAGGMLQSG